MWLYGISSNEALHSRNKLWYSVRIIYAIFFSSGAKFEEGRHQICIEDDEKYGIFRGIANVELICENRMVIHIVPDEEDFDTVYQSLKILHNIWHWDDMKIFWT